MVSHSSAYWDALITLVKHACCAQDPVFYRSCSCIFVVCFISNIHVLFMLHQPASVTCCRTVHVFTMFGLCAFMCSFVLSRRCTRCCVCRACASCVLVFCALLCADTVWGCVWV